MSASNEELHIVAGQAGREHIKNNFSENIIVPKYLDLYTGNSASIATE